MSNQRPLTVPLTPLSLPESPVWSIEDTFHLSSKQQPLPPATLQKLHKLSGLIPPTEGSKEWDELQRSLSGLIGIVESVQAPDVERMIDSVKEEVDAMERGLDRKDEREIDVVLREMHGLEQKVEGKPGKDEMVEREEMLALAEKVKEPFYYTRK